MWSRPESDESLVKRLLPSLNPNRADRLRAWDEWQMSNGRRAVLAFIDLINDSGEPNEDILQEALLTAYLEVERGRYEWRSAIPFSAYVKGIALNRVREARRKRGVGIALEKVQEMPDGHGLRQVEAAIEQSELYAALYQGLAKLPAQRREVLEQFLAGDSTMEIARRYALSEDGVRQHKSRGLRELRQIAEFNPQ